MIEPLASFGNFPSNTNLSRSVSLSIFDQHGNEISIETDLDNPIEIIIPRDPNLLIPPMIFQNVTSHNQSYYYKFIDIKQTQPNENLTISIHFEIHPLDKNLSYLFIYQYDHPLQLNQLDGWALFCPSNIKENIYTYYINNQKTSGHQSLIFGLRELNSTEMDNYCTKNLSSNNLIKNEESSFTSNYELRIYTSGCYYLDKNNNWQSYGLIVSFILKRILFFYIFNKGWTENKS